jgi:hypothetical protein
VKISRRKEDIMKTQRPPKTGKYGVLAFAIIFASFLFVGCGDDGDTFLLGGGADPGASSGTITGVVTNSMTGTPVEAADVTTDPAIQGVTITTDASGKYSATLPIGSYSLTCSANNFESHTVSITLVAQQTVTHDAALVPNSPVVVNAGSNLNGTPGGDAFPVGTYEILDGSAFQSILWEPSNSVAVTITDETTLTPKVTLPALDAYKDELFKVLEEPPIKEAELPPNVELPPGGFVGGIQDRFEVVGIDPFALEEAGMVTLKLTVTTDSGSFSDEVEIHTALPWKPVAGIENVPIGIPVLLHGKAQASYNWALVTPAGSSATLDDGAIQNPSFTPDVGGRYTVTVTDEATASAVEMEAFAANRWTGVISGQDGNGRPLAANCSGCHDGTFAPDNFTEWMNTGHSDIFSVNLNTSTHYGESCFPCHTVGFDLDAASGGIDDASDYAGFLAAGLLNNPGDNWTTVLANFPNTARLANIQCENCHGPQNNLTHGDLDITDGDARTSIRSNVCAVCHGEPLRHGRYQQWQLSRHANFELAVDEAQRESCARCHTGQGFLTWLPQLLAGDPGDLPAGSIYWTADTVQPQTCVVCHDPHDVGTSTGTGTDATVRVFGDTPVLPAGFAAKGVGNGAICITCHNSRRGLYNDAVAGSIRFQDGRAPHGSSQADVLMSQNAFFVSVGSRGAHSFIDDTCANCHMEKTPPPDLLAYNLGGTNHSFFGSINICSDCHTSIDGKSLQAATESEVEALIDDTETAISDLMNAVLATSALTLTEAEDGTGATVTDVPILAGTTVSVDHFGESHGRQAMDLTVDPGGPGETTYHVQLRRVELGSPASGNNLFATYNEGVVILKAGWNILLIENDGSLGVHNPSFSNAVLGAARNVLIITDFSTPTLGP